MWKNVLVIVLVFAVSGPVSSRTLDGKAEDITTRSRPHGRKVDSNSGVDSDLIGCTDCKVDVSTDAKKFQQNEEKPISRVGDSKLIENENSKKNRKGNRKRNRQERNRNRDVHKTRTPFISIGGVKIRINNQEAKHGRHRASRKHSKHSTKISNSAEEHSVYLDKVIDNTKIDRKDVSIRISNESVRVEQKMEEPNKDLSERHSGHTGDKNKPDRNKRISKTNSKISKPEKETPDGTKQEIISGTKDNIETDVKSKDDSDKDKTNDNKQTKDHTQFEKETVLDDKSNSHRTSKSKDTEIQTKSSVVLEKKVDNLVNDKHVPDTLPANNGKKGLNEEIENDLTKGNKKLKNEDPSNKKMDNSRSNTDRKKKSRRKSRRHRKKIRGGKKESLQPSGDQKDDRWSRPGLIQVPDVKRLERRLHPTVEAPVSDIVQSFRKILHQMQHSIYLIDFDYKHTFNVTRWNIMTGVREELLNIAKENDHVYDSVMDVSLHTKELYMRAHQRRRFGEIQALTMAPIRDQSGPRNIDLRSKYMYARDEMRSAELLKRKIRGLQRQRSTLRYDYMELTRKIAEKLPTRALYDLSRRVNQTIQTLDYSRAMRDAIDKGHLYRHSHQSTHRDMRMAREMVRKAEEIIEAVNRQYSINHMKAKEIKKARVSRYRNTTLDRDMFNMERWASVDRANIRANKLFNTAAMILMKFKPLLKEADLVIAKLKNGTLETKFERDVRNIREKLRELNATMFDIRTDVCTNQYEVCIPKVVEPDTEDIDKLEASGFDVDGDEDGSEESKIETDKPSGETDQDTTKITNGTTEDSKTDDAGKDTDTDTEADKDDDSDEIYFSGDDELDVEFSGDGEEVPTESTDDVEIIDDTQSNKTSIEPTQKTTIILPETDDEDIIEEMKHKKKAAMSTSPVTPKPTKKTTQTTTESQSTTKTTRITKKTTITTKPTTITTTKTPAPVEEEEEEDDGGGGWGGWWLDDPFGLIQDQMFGGNTRRKRDTGEVVITLSNITFSELIQQHLKNRSGVNKDLLKKAHQRLQAIEEVQKNFSRVLNHINQFDNNTMQIRGFTHKWKAKSAEFTTVHERVVDVSKDVKFKDEVFGEQIEKAVKKAESKLKRMRDVYEKNKDRVTDTSGPDNAAEALALAKTVKDNIAEMVNIKKLNPSPCQKLERMESMMRANISVLRQKIRQAKLVASSLKVAVNLDGTSHLALPVSTMDKNKQSEMNVEMTVKSSSDNGAIAVVQTKDTGAIAISLEDYKPTVTLYDGGQYKIEEKQSKTPLVNDTWYRIILNRFGSAYNFTVYNGTALVQSFLTQVDVDDYPTVYNRPSSVYVGGAHEDYYLDGWKGCVGNIRVNGESLNLLTANSESKVPKSCSVLSKDMAADDSLLLDGSGHAFYKLTARQLRSRVTKFTMNFTALSDGALFIIKAENNRFNVMAMVKERKLHIHVRHNNVKSNLISASDVIGIEHELQIISSGRSLDAMLNNRKDSFIKEKTSVEDLTTGRSHIGIHIGALLNVSSIRGCIQSIKLNNEDIPVNSMFDGENVTYGTCQEQGCLTFTKDSQPITLSNATSAAKSLTFVFSYGSRGDVLQFSKGEKFHLHVLIDEDGLALEETVKDNSNTIYLSEDDFAVGDDVLIIITDKDDKITVAVGDESETFSYGSNGGGGFFGLFGIGNNDDDDDADTDVEYSINIGGTGEESKAFTGNLVSLRIENRSIDLSSYVATNKVHRCTLSTTAPAKKTKEIVRTPLKC